MPQQPERRYQERKNIRALPHKPGAFPGLLGRNMNCVDSHGDVIAMACVLHKLSRAGPKYAFRR